MAIQLLKENDRFNTYHQHFLIDGSDDLTSLEANYKCQMGDIVEAVDGTRYIRHSDEYSGDLWEEAGSSSSGGSGLPNYSEANNGDVLSIEDGEPAWKEQSGGDMFVVTLLQDDATTKWTADKTYAEIMAAYGAGKICLFNINNVSFAYGTFVPPNIRPNAPIYVSVFAYIHTEQADALQAGTCIIASDNSVTSNANYFSLTPMGG